MDTGLNERDWKLLLKRISDGKCTPLIGPAVNQAHLPDRKAIAARWSSEFGYPLQNGDLARVAQYLSIEYDPYFPKEEIQKQIETAEKPDFTPTDQPHAVLANLQLPIYITTNYDNFMMDALQQHKKDPRRELCRWNPYLQRSHPSILETGYTPTPANPLIYHLHGHIESPESLVLTEDDYLDFLINISSDEYELPPRIQQALTDSSLLFIGYKPGDWDFRVLFRGLVAAAEKGLRRISVTVQLPPLPADSAQSALEKIQRYLSKYFDHTDRQMRVYWGTTEEFITELNRRWQGVEQAKRSTEAVQPTIDLMRLQLNLSDMFNLQELRQMAQFELRIDYETFADTKPAFILELVTYMQRRGRLYELAKTGQRLRSHGEWF
ncbi:MAG: SIR2 family protein [Chloroflexi bacterium]|nr:SIR2 family protein [Chloroflexota bacterium]